MYLILGTCSIYMYMYICGRAVVLCLLPRLQQYKEKLDELEKTMVQRSAKEEDSLISQRKEYEKVLTQQRQLYEEKMTELNKLHTQRKVSE